MTSPVTLTGACPDCGHALKLCQAKTGQLYIGCSAYPRCDFRGAYDPVLQQLRDHNARLQAELTLLQMQQTPPIPPEQQHIRTPWDVRKERQRTLRTWTAIAARWGGTVREGRGR